MLKKFISILLIGTLCISICACGSSSDPGVDDVVDQAANAVQSNNKYILAVKNSSPKFCPEITYGEAFDEFFSSPTWKYFKGTKEGPDDDEDGEPDYTVDDVDIVEFTGRCEYQGVKVKVLLQFSSDPDSDTFEATYLSFNEVPQSSLILIGLVEAAFNNYEKNHGTDTDSASNEALNYSGTYEGYSYKIVFDAYSTLDGDSVGTAKIYYDGDLEDEQFVYLSNDQDDWEDYNDYDAFYAMHLDGYDNYLGFYKSDGKIMLDYNGDSHNIETLEKTE